MSMIKKIVSLLFDEGEPDVYVEDELETISLDEKKDKKEEKVEVKQETKQEVKQEVQPEEIVKQGNKEEIIEQKNSFTNIEITDLQPKNEIKLNLAKREESKIEYEFQPVISPMFGSKEEDLKKKSVSNQPKNKNIKKKTNPLGTIISPYFGVNDQEDFQVEPKEKFVVKEKITETNMMTMNKNDEEEKSNVPLEDIISDSNHGEDNDLLQYSLYSHQRTEE